MFIVEAIILENEEIARRFELIASILESRDVNPYRVQAYRNAARILRELDRSVAEIIAREGVQGLQQIPGIGKSLARSIEEFLYTGRMSVMDRIRGRTDPVSLISTLPGIGPELAERIYEYLGVHTLEDLEAAAHDGNLAEVPGFGPKRIEMVIDVLAGRFGGRRRFQPAKILPAVEEMLDVDQEYREKAAAGTLRKIAPKRFNPSGEEWLPVLHTRRANHYYTALFSNTARAHELGRTNDWVVLYYDTPEGSGQATVITSKSGPLNERRVVRGRERESREYYVKRRAA